MNKKIIIAGAGHGGIVAATKLGAKGYDVTIYEKNEEENLGHDQSDYFDLNALSYSKIPVPKKGVTGKVPITFISSDENASPITQNIGEDSINLCVDRHEFLSYLVSRAKKNGVKFVFGCNITEPIVYGNRVCGFKTDKGDILGDLVIDACGINSPVRKNLPENLNIEKEAGTFNTLYAYRAYYDRVEGEPDPEFMYKVYLTSDGSDGMQWVVTDEDSVDILIGRFRPIREGEIEEEFEKMRKDNPHLSDKLIRGGKIIEIPVRQPLPVLVADGYAAIGDSAFMTIAIKGSGIGYNLRAGSILAKAIEHDTEGKYSAESLWEYQTTFFSEIGFGACTMAVIKNIFPYLTAEEVAYAFKEKIISERDLNLSGEGGIMSVLSNIGIHGITDKVKKLFENEPLKKKFTDTAIHSGQVKLLMTNFPKEYNRENIEKWVDKYNTFFNEIKPDYVAE